MNKLITNTPFRVLIVVWILSPLFLSATPPQPPNPSSYNEGEFLLQFSPTASPAFIQAWQDSLNATEVWETENCSFRLWSVNFPTNTNPPMTNINEVIGKSKSKPEINSAGLDFRTDIPDAFGGITPGGAPPDFFCPNVYSDSCAVGTNTTKIAILDTGIGLDSRSGHLMSDELFDPYFNYSYLGYDFVNHDNLPEDFNGHGTHMAGIIAAYAENTEAHAIELYAFQTHNAAGYGNISDIILAIDRAISDRVQLMNMSFSYYSPIPVEVKPHPLQAAIDCAGYEGILTVAAAGNDSYDIDPVEPLYCYPASYPCPSLITVASVGCAGIQSSYSNFGLNSVDVGALGERLVAPDHLGQYKAANGTSGATAYVSALAGILYSKLIFQTWLPVKQSVLSGVEIPTTQLEVNTGGIVHFKHSMDSLLLKYGIDYRAAATQNNIDFKQRSLQVYPNPVQQSFTAVYRKDQAGIVDVRLYDIRGSLLWNEQRNEGEGIVETPLELPNSLTPGTYILQLRTEDQYYSQKIIKR
ncbi:MAG: S8 family peptidase [Bacteroidota bacterium]